MSKIHLGRKEALTVMQPYGVGIRVLRRWIATVPGLHVRLPGCKRGHIIRAKLIELLNTTTKP